MDIMRKLYHIWRVKTWYSLRYMIYWHFKTFIMNHNAMIWFDIEWHIIWQNNNVWMEIPRTCPGAGASRYEAGRRILYDWRCVRLFILSCSFRRAELTGPESTWQFQFPRMGVNQSELFSFSPYGHISIGRPAQREKTAGTAYAA